MRERILSFVQSYQETHGFSPTVREIGEAVELASPATVVHHHLRVLQQQGRLTWSPFSPRTIRVRRAA